MDADCGSRLRVRLIAAGAPLREAHFWRTFSMIAALVLFSLLAIFTSYRALDRTPPEQRLAWEIASIVNLTRSALLGSDPARRLSLLEELAREEEVRVSPLEANDRVDGPVDTQRLRAIEPPLKQLLGANTVVAARVNGEDGVWVSFEIAGDGYWLQLPARRLERQIDPGLGMILLITALVALVGALALSWLVDRPLAELSRALAALSRGDIPPRLSEQGRSGMAEANRRFNRMAAEHAALEHDRSLALAGISHDIRSPLTRLRMDVEMASLDASQRASMAEEIERIDAIVGQFVEYARTGQTPRAQIVDVSAEVALLAHPYRVAPQTTLISLNIDVPSKIHWYGDPVDLGRVLGNLIDNAIRHARVDGSPAPVAVEARRDADRLLVRVQDRGPGIPMAQLEEALRPFSRLDPARSDRGGVTPGTGLGLAIVARIAQRYRGSVRLQPAPGGGLIAEVSLPDWRDPRER